MVSKTWMCQCWQKSKYYIHEISVDTGCNLEALSEARYDGNEWQKRVRKIRAVRLDYIYIYIYIYIYTLERETETQRERDKGETER